MTDVMLSDFYILDNSVQENLKAYMQLILRVFKKLFRRVISKIIVYLVIKRRKEGV